MNETKVSVPSHIAIIMDGNRRWARAKGLPISAGHRKVANDILEPLIEHAARLGVKYLTFWAWSTENWQRDRREVEGIMRIFQHVISKRWQRLHQKGVRIRTIGDISAFKSEIREALEKVTVQAKNNTTITVTFALNYGGRDEIVRAINRVIRDKQYVISEENDKRLTSHVSHITQEDFSAFLDTAGIPDPELIVRTGGEQRLSGFLPWQGVYSELYFPSWFMPEFTPEKLDEAIGEYKRRQRRFGK